MNANVGTVDRVLRLILGAVLVALYLYGTVVGGWGIVLLIAGIVLLATALFRFCPIYRLFGANTCGR
jgi:hypothetical protein